MIRKSILAHLFVWIGAIFSIGSSFAQSTQFQPDKSGKYIVQNKLNKCPGTDIATISKNLTNISEWVRLNDSIVNKPVGNDTRVSLSGNLCDKQLKNEDYGIQCQIYFAFHHFYIENGVSQTATGNTAHGTEIIINDPIRSIGVQFTETGFQTDDPTYLKQPLAKALENLKTYYTTAPILKEIAPGVRLFAPNSGWFKGVLLVFNPERPDIWIPITVKEIMEAKLAYYKIKQEIDSINYKKTLASWAKMNFKPEAGQMIRPLLYNVIKKEFENFTTAELSRPAFSSPQSGISTINALGEGGAVVRFNPACWNQTMPETSVQFMSMEYRPATTHELEDFKPRNGGLVDYVGLFFNNLPVEKMGELIQKK
jgi:hypothetical protein